MSTVTDLQARTTHARILVVEDETDLNRVLVAALTEQGYAVDGVCDGASARRVTLQNAYDVIVLDLGLPDTDGRTLCREWRRKDNSAAIVMLTAQGTLASRVSGLDSGADDYLVKPFSMRELLARIRALDRRADRTGVPASTLTVADLTLDTATHRVTRGTRQLSLTYREYSIIRCLMERVGRIVTRDELLRVVWDGQHDASSNVIDVYLSRIRQHLTQGEERPILETIRGVGYRLPPLPEPSSCR